jgi:uncharacterized protein
MNIVFWGALTRMIQAGIHASPTIVVGIFVAAVFRCVLGRNQTFHVFGGHTWRQIPQAWGMGMLLPVCSLGAIPVMSELRKASLVGGTIIAFGLTAPIFNPVSVLYGLSLSHPVVMATICICSLLIVTIVGLAWDWVFPNESVLKACEADYPQGWRRIVAVGLAMLRIGWSLDLLWMMVGVIGVGVLASCLSHGALGTSAEHKDVIAPLRMAIIAMPAYITPMDAMVQLSNMFQHGNSIAAAFTLLILGTGLNLGLLAWSISSFGWRKTLAWVAMTMILVVGLGYAIARPLYPAGIVPEGHTHAYDNFCSPMLDGEDAPASRCISILVNSTQAYETVSFGLWCVIIAGGVLAWRLDPTLKWEAALRETLPKTSANKVRDIVLPAKLVGALAIVGLLLASVLGCFVYYPPTEQVLADLSVVNSETCSRAMSGDTFGALHWIPVYEDKLKKLEVGVMLRGSKLNKKQMAAIATIEEMLEELEHAMGDKQLDEGRVTARNLADAYMAFRKLMR